MWLESRVGRPEVEERSGGGDQLKESMSEMPQCSSVCSVYAFYIHICVCVYTVFCVCVFWLKIILKTYFTKENINWASKFFHLSETLNNGHPEAIRAPYLVPRSETRQLWRSLLGNPQKLSVEAISTSVTVVLQFMGGIVIVDLCTLPSSWGKQSNVRRKYPDVCNWYSHVPKIQPEK